MRFARILVAAGAMCATIVSACIAQPAWITAQSVEEPIKFFLSPDTVETAFSSMCLEPVGRPCDVRSNYNVQVVIRRGTVGVVFFHVDDARRDRHDFVFVPNFTCQFRGVIAVCTDAREAPDIR